MAYRLISELMSEEYDVLIVNGANIRKQFFISTNGSTEDDEFKEVSKQPVFILDDRGTGVGVASSYITLEDIYQILRVILLLGKMQARSASTLRSWLLEAPISIIVLFYLHKAFRSDITTEYVKNEFFLARIGVRFQNE